MNLEDIDFEELINYIRKQMINFDDSLNDRFRDFFIMVRILEHLTKLGNPVKSGYLDQILAVINELDPSLFDREKINI